MFSVERFRTMMGITTESNTPLRKRLFWMVILWTGSVLALGLLSWLLRLFMTAAGLGSH